LIWTDPKITDLAVQHMEKTTPLDSVSTALTVEKWVGKIKTWQEPTSTSPSGMHLGHHKCIAVPFLPDHAESTEPSPSPVPGDTPGWTQTTIYQWIQSALQSPDLDTHTEHPSTHSPPASPPSDTTPISYEDMRKDLLTAQVAMINYCIKHCYPLQRWKRVVIVFGSFIYTRLILSVPCWPSSGAIFSTTL
jgi:hypothetical protein